MLAHDCTPSRADRAILAMTPADIERFWSKVDKTPGHGPNGDCHVWMGCCDSDGYGVLQLHGAAVRAHRIAYYLDTGRLPRANTPLVLHSCDYRLCARNTHLREGTTADNTADMIGKGRNPRGDTHGLRIHPEKAARMPGEQNGMAKLTEEQVVQLRARYAAGGISLRAIGQEYGISGAAAHLIVNRTNWSHI